MIFELAWEVGWRRGSLLSLTTADFKSARSSREGEITISPKSQKFGYSKSFVISARLAARVIDFIDRYRLADVANPSKVGGALFINQDTGQSLTLGTVSNIFCTASRKLGWPRGGGIHCWRRGFSNAYLECEIDARLEAGLDTSPEALAMSLANALGHESLDSQKAYVRDAKRRIRGTATFRDKEEMSRLADENARLRGEIAALRRDLDGRP